MCLWVYRYIKLALRTFNGTKVSTERYGKDSWAIVTGASGGLGRAAAHHLASKGFNIIMVANEGLKMTAVEQEITKKYPKVKVEKHILDFGRNYQIKDFEDLYNKIKHHDISILVNNVGFIDGNIFTEISENSVHTMMAVNCYSIALLSKLVLTSFKKRWLAKK